MHIDSIYSYFGHKFRARRMQDFVSMFGVTTRTRVLDVGGTPFNWNLINVQPQITFLNVVPFPDSNIIQLTADGCFLPFRENEFDIVYSNSVIEHLYTFENQLRFARECSRVGRQLYIQTPNHDFWFEPHWLTPFFHWLPTSMQRKLARNFTGRGILNHPTMEECDQLIDELRLLRENELTELFPGGRINHERFLLGTKSFVVTALAR